MYQLQTLKCGIHTVSAYRGVCPATAGCASPHLVNPASAVTRLSASTSAPAPSTSAVRARPARLGTFEMSEATTMRSLRRVPAGPDWPPAHGKHMGWVCTGPMASISYGLMGNMTMMMMMGWVRSCLVVQLLSSDSAYLPHTCSHAH